MKDYTIIKNVLNGQTLELLKTSLLILKDAQYAVHQVPNTDSKRFADELVSENCWGSYAVPVIEALMVNLQSQIENIAGIKLFPTYSYTRIYWTGASMRPHVDRPSCEYSVSLCIDIDPDPWPIFMDGDSIILQPGDMVVYKGLDVQHWRETYTGKQQIQAFLHYVDANGPFADCKLDYRPVLGVTLN
jgi:hypothetical protein